jgi:putative tricarboxylic transport membrane protein
LSDGAAARPGELALGLVGAALGALVLQQTAAIPVAATYARISPRLIPFVVGGGLVALGLVMAARAALALKAPRGLAPPLERTDWAAFSLAAVALLVHRFVLEPLGFVPAATLLFVAMAWALGSRALGRDLIAGAVLAALIWVGLGRGLGLQLPMGPLDGVL